MNEHDSADASSTKTSETSRRAVLRAGAAVWAAPVIVAVAAAPAVAASGTLSFIPGTTRIVANNQFYDVQFTGASIRCTGAIGLNELRLTVTFTPTSSNGIYKTAANPLGWTSNNASGDASLVYTRTLGSLANTSVGFPNGAYFGTRNAGQEGTFLLTFSAPGATSTSFTVRTPNAAARGTADASTGETR